MNCIRVAGAALSDGLHERFEMKRINHQEAYSFDGACTNQAEEYFSRMASEERRPQLAPAGAVSV